MKVMRIPELMEDFGGGPGPTLPPGSALFYNPGVSETNTYTGTVVLSNTNAPITLPGGLYTLVGSLPPIAPTSFEDTNLNLPLQSGDGVLLWDSVNRAGGTHCAQADNLATGSYSGN
jgi:hypothetical protein